MNEEKCFCHFNGYKVKDATARNEIEILKTKTNSLENEVTTNKTTISNMNTDVVKNKTDVEVIKQDIETIKTNVNLHTDSINSLNESNTNLDRKMGELSTLQTTDKSSIVNAVNEIKLSFDSFSTEELISLVQEQQTKIQELESEVATLSEEPEWIDLECSLTDDVPFMQYKKKGNDVYIRGRVNGYSFKENDRTICTLPEELRPKYQIGFLPCSTAGTYVNLGIVPDGRFLVSSIREMGSNEVSTISVWFLFEYHYSVDPETTISKEE